MTGFGSASTSEFAVEVRSLNHRFMDISIKMPQCLSPYEIPLRNILKERFQRGRFDISITMNSERQAPIGINTDTAKNIYSSLRDLKEALSITGEIDIRTLAGFREIIMEKTPDFDIGNLYNAFREAVSNLEDMRVKEGKFLAEDILARLGILRDLNNRIKLLAPETLVRWKEKITERLKLILDAEMIDNSRILQEAAIMAEKLDISEETGRIENHLKQIGETLRVADTAGKRLDFLVQEINREVNTLSSKAADYSIANYAVDMKTEVEKIREQIQNLQ
jgi:uncharacterized protein (TIGR00255 family)